MDEALIGVARETQRRAYGVYRGFVVGNDDPEGCGRLLLKVPSVLGSETSGWALPCLPSAGLADQEWFAVPEEHALVWVMFEAGDVSRPVWMGTFWQRAEDVPSGIEPQMTGLFETPAGQNVQPKRDQAR